MTNTVISMYSIKTLKSLHTHINCKCSCKCKQGPMKKQTLDIFQLRVNGLDLHKISTWGSERVKVKVLCLRGYTSAG